MTLQCWTVTWWWVGKEDREPMVRGYFSWEDVKLQLDVVSGAARVLVESHEVRVSA